MTNHVIIAWATDIHLDHEGENKDFFDKVLLCGADAIFITGDIAEAPTVANYIMDMETMFNVPIYFVLGNHDYYHGSIKRVRAQIETATSSIDNVHWLPASGVQEITSQVCVIGVDGWHDGQYGDVDPPKLIMCDWECIKELRPYRKDHKELLGVVRSLAGNEAAKAEGLLREAAEKYSTVYFLTHIPPWPEAAWHEDTHSGPAWVPWFTCKAVGDVLEDMAAEFPLVNFEVLTGHCHGSGELLVAPNLRCRTGAAEYGKPAIADMICIKKT